jgi:3-hydroxy-9,10-secoandrosta-1,3,5(10)-triene-9,17-dione monooxygenase
MALSGTQRAIAEVFGPDVDVRIAGSASPLPARPVDGGVVITGQWSYASGSPHAAWAMVAVSLPDQPAPQMCLVPARDLTLVDTWRVAGMRATGSNTWAADNVFVPEHRLVSMAAINAQPVPFSVVGALTLLGPLLGSGQAALDFVTAQATRKPLHHTLIERQSDSVGIQILVAQAALKLQTARLHSYAMADEADAAADSGTPLSYDDRARIRATSGYVAQLVIEALQMLMNAHGAGSFADANPLQRHWRDANTAARHAGFNAMVGYEVFGKALLGNEERITPFV